MKFLLSLLLGLLMVTSNAPAQGAPAQGAPAPGAPAQSFSAGTFAIGENDFLLNGKPYVIRCGEIHSDRVPPEYWRNRLQMCKAMGLNTVCAYLYWNVHEPKEGEFTFKDAADVAQFCRIAAEENLHVILRPGPYSCAEWEFGGFPWWLLKTADIKLRTRDPRYLNAAKRYLMRVGKELAPLQINRGGPIIMVQVENEYGSYGSDKEYMGIVRDTLKEAGFEVPLFHCDGPSQLPRDHRDDIFAVVNFGGNPEGSFEALRKVQPKGPLMCGEYYPGWFDSWGRAHHTGNTANVVKELKWMLDHKASFSIYMAHGGTSFGFTAGANSPPFAPQSTSYDYDAPISEAGWDTEKFHAIRDLFSRYLQPGEELPPVPTKRPVIAVPTFELKESSPLLSNLGRGTKSLRPVTMENLDQAHGCLLYRTTLHSGPAARLVIKELHDYGLIFLDGEKIATLDRRRGQSSCPIPARSQDMKLDILVEAFGRVNYGPHIHDRKGITESVQLVSPESSLELLNWTMVSLPLDAKQLKGQKYKVVGTGKTEKSKTETAKTETSKTEMPALWRGSFDLETVGDTFLDTSHWNKGMVWVNGHNLGRYWGLGPQQTLYTPAPWLKKGRNEVVVFEINGTTEFTLQGLTTPILDEAHPEASRLHRKAGQTLDLAGATPIYSGTLANSDAWQTVQLPTATTGRYLTLEALSSHPGDNFAALAEIYAQDAQGKDLPRDSWQILYADSEEQSGEDGSADNVFDLQATTYWHTRWTGEAPSAYPHQIVIDLGQNVTLSGLRLLQRPGTLAAPARIKDFRIFLAAGKPAGL
jgi:beta-galactosidase